MSSVTKRISEIKQPRGGYLKIADMHETRYEDGYILNNSENTHPSIIGLVVDYLTRFMLGSSAEKAFNISLLGAANYSLNTTRDRDAILRANEYISNINGLDDKSIISACKLASFDVWFRNADLAFQSKSDLDTNPDIITIENIKIMVKRAFKFFKEYGQIIAEGFTFETDGYTEIVNKGDGDYIIGSTLWDLKVSKAKPTSKHTLQILMYWIMGQHSKKDIFKDIDSIGIFNPRLNICYTIKISEIHKNVIEQIEKEVICY